jgi:hypothetical protein
MDNFFTATRELNTVITGKLFMVGYGGRFMAAMREFRNAGMFGENVMNQKVRRIVSAKK